MSRPQAGGWISCGDARFSQIVWERGQPGNYKSLFVQRLHRGNWVVTINGANRGSRKSKVVAMRAAERIADDEFQAGHEVAA